MRRAMVLEPGELAEVRHIDLETVQKLIGEDIEMVRPFDDDLAVLVNSQGKILGLELNRAQRDEDGHIEDVFAGTMVVISLNGDLTDDQVSFLLDQFGKVETSADWEEDEDPLEQIISLLAEIFS